MKRLCIEIQGQVQGVGFRPYVYRLANELRLTGFVKNNAIGVEIEIQGKFVDTFLKRLQMDLPPLAEIDAIDHTAMPLNLDESTFRILKSEAGKRFAKIVPDITICDDCLAELFDINSRYYHYPFINCTNCGPRYTITQQLPYDRQFTSMNAFAMCAACQHAYENPMDRRYHAQPIACGQCGPKMSHTIEEIAEAIKQGNIVALKAVGGYQFVCDANNKIALQRLREIKARAKKPFALMVKTIDCAKKIVDCNVIAQKLLTSRERPIVLLPKKNKNLPEMIAPNLKTLGVMLPYSAIHHLLFDALTDTVLVVTSANPGDCPIIVDDEQAQQKLSAVSDILVSYDREIITRVDDSVVGVIDNKPAFIRRSRSYVPRAISLPFEIPPILALGGYLKNTICITRGKEAFLSQHIGDLNQRETIQFYKQTITHVLKILDVEPVALAHDHHPNFYSTQIAAEFSIPAFAVQHHHAHLAACAAEHGLTNQAIGLALDGYGLGENQESWGGELMQYNGAHYQRLGSLKPLMQPGGDVASKQPWRMAVSVLFALGKTEQIDQRFHHHPEAKRIVQMLEQHLHTPLTSSCGRLFDAASALLGICEYSDYEGEAAMRLESLVSALAVEKSGWKIESNQLNLLPLFKRLLSCDAMSGANLFHGTLAQSLVEWVTMHLREKKIKHVLLAGGCFLNKILSEAIITQLKESDFIPLYPRQCPPNDGGLSLGQAWVVGQRLLENGRCV